MFKLKFVEATELCTMRHACLVYQTYASEAGGVPQRGRRVRRQQRARGRGARQRVRALVRGATAAGAVFPYRCKKFTINLISRIRSGIICKVITSRIRLTIKLICGIRSGIICKVTIITSRIRLAVKLICSIRSGIICKVSIITSRMGFFFSPIPLFLKTILLIVSLHTHTSCVT